ncbi:MAG: ABC transporter ATP-binding protein [Pseudomonadota bacterium]|nr:ABC transporter ATP-binding protein [Pseudomonadota bacterium]
MAELILEQLRKSYGPKVAVETIDLKVPSGHFCIFLGPSGCGKSTTLNCIAGLEETTSGKIFLGGRDITNLQPHQRDIAMVFQSALLYPHLSAHDNIRMSLRTAQLSRANAEEKIARAAKMLDITPLLEKKPSAMSGGERQRVAIAKAVVRDPAAFLLDEPLSALDAALRQSLRSELVHLQKQLGVTTIFVTHDQVEAMTMGDMIVVMNKGRIEQVGTPQEVYEAPKTRFVAGFVGSPPMNFFRGRLIGENGGVALHSGAARFELPRALVGGFASHGAEVDLGVRPQHVTLSPTPAVGALPVRVYAVERLGKENVIVVEDEAKNTYRALTAPTVHIAIDDRAFLRADLGNAFLFSCAS